MKIAGTWGRRTLGVPLLFASLALAQQERPPDQEPIESGLVEETGRRLVQIDVSFTPKKKAALPFPELTTEDFDLVVMGRTVQVEYADRICSITRTESAVTEGAATEPAPAEPPRTAATYIFYIEHTLLTMRGQNVAFDMVGDLIPELIRGGNRGMVVSSGSKVIQSPLGTDPEELLDTLRGVQKDTKQWSEYVYAENETERYDDVFSQPSDGAMRIAARSFQLEELRITSNRMRRLAALLGGLAEVDPPKAVFYFADMARKRPGEHFLQTFASRDLVQGPYSAGGAALGQPFDFDNVLAEANAQGVRLYTIQAQGFKAQELAPSATPNQAPNTRIREAEETMRGFALETGGEMFFGGSDAATMTRVVKRVDEDLGCLYVLNFYPDELPEDQPMPVRVRLNETERGRAAAAAFDYRTRGQLVVQSRERRQESLLLAAHIAEETVGSDPGRGVVIPLAFADGAYTGLAQFVVRGSDIAGRLSSDCVWDLGMTHVVGVDVRGSVSARVEVKNPSAPVVLETLWSFEPGLNEIISVGREHRLDQLSTVQLDLEWPDPDQARATISPIAVVQQYDGVFLRKEGQQEQVRYTGTLGIGSGLVNAEQPAYLIGLVCRGKRVKDDLWIRRRLAGEDAADFELLEWKASEGERCIQVRDFLRAGQVSLGDFVYEVFVYDNPALEGEPVTSARREFSAMGTGSPPPATAPAPADAAGPASD